MNRWDGMSIERCKLDLSTRCDFGLAPGGLVLADRFGLVGELPVDSFVVGGLDLQKRVFSSFGSVFLSSSFFFFFLPLDLPSLLYHSNRGLFFFFFSWMMVDRWTRMIGYKGASHIISVETQVQSLSEFPCTQPLRTC
ncbi:hypothetical protein K435DRAFT_212052 [Dendrothele bispora CBS 962.96]|uniref:Uncharacterized protein n=1 Tax=Dendrothele bispora (strain CBS 962.96) TaxID=1314807 RepID=A0A4S8MMM4_DENBC|nr:hypothetical protein K435DRAFT_212052 [Dendrothele bispora CBS 962.96]